MERKQPRRSIFQQPARSPRARQLMLIPLDQGTPVGIRDSLHGHTVKTARQQGWSMFLNGELLRAPEEAEFDVLLTTDKNLIYQQNLTARKIAIVVLGRNRWSLIRRALPRIVDAVNAAQPGSYPLVEIPEQ